MATQSKKSRVASRAATLIARTTKKPWRPAGAGASEFVDEVLRHNIAAPPSERVGRRKLKQWLLSEFKITVGSEVLARYMAQRTGLLK